MMEQPSSGIDNDGATIIIIIITHHHHHNLISNHQLAIKSLADNGQGCANHDFIHHENCPSLTIIHHYPPLLSTIHIYPLSSIIHHYPPLSTMISTMISTFPPFRHLSGALQIDVVPVCQRMPPCRRSSRHNQPQLGRSKRNQTTGGKHKLPNGWVFTPKIAIDNREHEVCSL